MIKLEDLKMGDKFYGVHTSGRGLVAESTVLIEKIMLDRYPNEVEAVICKGGVEIVTRSEERYLHRTRESAVLQLKLTKVSKALKLLESEEFIDRLFEYATTPKRLSDYGEKAIFEIAVDIYKKRLKGEL